MLKSIAMVIYSDNTLDNSIASIFTVRINKITMNRKRLRMPSLTILIFGIVTVHRTSGQGEIGRIPYSSGSNF